METEELKRIVKMLIKKAKQDEELFKDSEWDAMKGYVRGIQTGRVALEGAFMYLLIEDEVDE